jgi:predicted transcriptional regulator
MFPNKELSAKCDFCKIHLLRGEKIVQIELTTVLSSDKDFINCTENTKQLHAHATCFRKKFPDLYLMMKFMVVEE